MLLRSITVSPHNGKLTLGWPSTSKASLLARRRKRRPNELSSKPWSVNLVSTLPTLPVPRSPWPERSIVWMIPSISTSTRKSWIKRSLQLRPVCSMIVVRVLSLTYLCRSFEEEEESEGFTPSYHRARCQSGR